MSLTTLPPIKRSPLVCFSSPQMMRKNVVLPQPEGPSSTMNSPSGTVRLMPLTAGTSPNFLTISLVNTAAIEPPRIQHRERAPPIPQSAKRPSRLPLKSTHRRHARTAHEHAVRVSDQALPAHFFMMASHCRVANLTESSALDCPVAVFVIMSLM